MERLYAISHRGSMFYLSGYIPEGKYVLVEKLANQLKNDTPESYRNLVDELHTNLGIELKLMPIEYIFRIKRK